MEIVKHSILISPIVLWHDMTWGALQSSYFHPIVFIFAAAIKTEVFETRAQQMKITVDKLMEKYAPFHAMGRVGVPDECAAAIVFLASNAASFITGATLAVDGGALLGYWSNRTIWTD